MRLFCAERPSGGPASATAAGVADGSVSEGDGTCTIRPYRLAKDAAALCDLADAAYVEDYARLGRSARAEMERERRLEGIIRWTRLLFPALRDASRGLVYESGGRIVSAVMFTREGLSGDHWTIDTVATHPEFQRRGLARALLESAIEAIEGRGGGVCTLKVREDNPAAYRLYRSAGFEHFDTTVHMKREAPPTGAGSRLADGRIRELALAEWYDLWRARWELARDSAPETAQAIVPIGASQFRKSRFVRFLAPTAIRVSGFAIRHWAVECNDRLAATLTVRGDTTGNRNHEIDLCVAPDHEAVLAGGLLDLGLSSLSALPHAATLVETRGTTASVIRALEERSFATMSTWHWLGRRLSPR